MWARPLRFAASAGAALALVCAAGGCAIVPTNGNPVPAKEESGSDPLSQPYVRIIASPPKPGGQPREIVDGFRAAMASVDDSGWKIARQYLTSDALAMWDPEAGVTVYDQGGKPALEEVQEQVAAISFRGTITATIDPDGRYRDVQAAGLEQDADFRLTKVGKEWRISQPPPGLLLSPADIHRAYRTFDLYYPDISGRWLVADQVTIPIDPSKSQAETLVRWLLKGPSTSIRGAVANVLPSGTRLIRVVPDGDSVIVDFTSEMTAIIGRPDQLRAMAAQIAWTLRDLVPGPIQIRANGEPLAGLDQSIKWGNYQEFNPAVLSGKQPAYFMLGGVLRRMNADAGHPIVEGAPGQAAMGFTSPAISGTGEPAKVAVLGDKGGLYVAGMVHGSQWDEWVHSAKGGTLTPPSWDRYGVVWTAENSDEGLRVWTARDGTPRRVMVPSGLATAHVSALRISRDGARAAMIVDNGGGSELKVGAVIRDGDGRVDELQTLIEAKPEQKILDVAWMDWQRLAVLSESKNGRVFTVYSITDGKPDAPKSAADFTTISAVGDSILGSKAAGGDAGRDGGEVLSWDGKKNEWKTEVKDGAATPVYPLG